jgi:calcineurin-like phosphoesterase family protein
MKRTFSSVLALALFLLVAVNADLLGQRRNGNGKAAAAAGAPVTVSLPRKNGSVRFAVIGDTGTGTSKQHELGDILLNSRQAFPYEFVLLLGDNLYGGEQPADYKSKFQDVYQQLLDQKVKFYAALGNHDEPAQRFYKDFNMEGKEFYRFTKGNASFYALNSNYMDKKQVDWLEDQLSKDTSEWKIAFCHHPPYSSGGKHGSDDQLRKIVEPIFVKHGVNVVFTGHDHFYERIKPQKGIFYFVSGAGGKLRSGDVKDSSPLTAKAFDKDMSFMLIEIVDNAMHFQVLSRTGATVDSGVLPNPRPKK